MKPWQVGIFLLAIAAWAHGAPAQSTQPAQLPLEYRANTAFTQGRYVVALPLLEELAGTLIDQPKRLGPVEQRIQVCKHAIAVATKMAQNAAATQPVVDLSAGRTPHPAPSPGQVVDLDLEELGNFNYDAKQGGNIPADVTRLNGATFRTRGYMIPMDAAQSISEFALVPRLWGDDPHDPPPKVQQVVVVHLAPNAAIPYCPDKLQVEGTLHVQEKRDQGYIVSIFDLDATSVKPAPR